jgi:hypothetical protein
MLYDILPQTRNSQERFARLIDGFETPYGMELVVLPAKFTHQTPVRRHGGVSLVVHRKQDLVAGINLAAKTRKILIRTNVLPQANGIRKPTAECSHKEVSPPEWAGTPRQPAYRWIAVKTACILSPSLSLRRNAEDHLVYGSAGQRRISAPSI